MWSDPINSIAQHVYIQCYVLYMRSISSRAKLDNIIKGFQQVPLAAQRLVLNALQWVLVVLFVVYPYGTSRELTVP